MYQPTDALESPRFTGPRTFARLPYVRDLAGVDCAIYGIPWDGGTSFRPGARFGPEAIRSVSALLRPYNPEQRVLVFGSLSLVDYGDAPTVPGYIEDTLERAAEYVRTIAAAGVVPIALGGDHSITLAELRGIAAVRGPLGLLQIDAHGDLWDEYFGRPYNHGTVFRRAVEEGLIDPSRCLQLGMRGSLYTDADLELPVELGIEVVRGAELAALSAEEVGALARQRLGDGPAFFTFDVDVVDPAFCPATGTPEVGGITSARALDLIRALHGIDFAGYDVVEVAAPYDGPGQPTALLAANVVYEMLSLEALRRR